MNCIKIELKRLFCSRGFKAVLFIEMLFVLSHAAVVAEYAKTNSGMVYPEMSIPFSSFMFFIGYDMYGWQGSIFFQMLPLLAALPYANSYFIDISDGYAKNILSRARKKDYLISKYITIFLSGGIVAVIPLLLDIMICMALLPSYLPNAGTGMFAIIGSSLYYAHPYFYLLMFLAIDFLIGGIYAVTALLVTNFIENRYLLVIFPYVAILLWQFVAGLTNTLQYWPVNLSIPQVHTGGPVQYAVTILGMILLTFTVYYIRGIKRDEF